MEAVFAVKPSLGSTHSIQNGTEHLKVVACVFISPGEAALEDIQVEVWTDALGEAWQAQRMTRVQHQHLDNDRVSIKFHHVLSLRFGKRERIEFTVRLLVPDEHGVGQIIWAGEDGGPANARIFKAIGVDAIDQIFEPTDMKFHRTLITCDNVSFAGRLTASNNSTFEFLKPLRLRESLILRRKNKFWYEPFQSNNGWGVQEDMQAVLCIWKIECMCVVLLPSVGTRVDVTVDGGIMVKSSRDRFHEQPPSVLFAVTGNINQAVRILFNEMDGRKRSLQTPVTPFSKNPYFHDYLGWW